MQIQRLIEIVVRLFVIVLSLVRIFVFYRETKESMVILFTKKPSGATMVSIN